MVENYRIQVGIGLTNNISPALAVIMRDLAGLGGRIKSVEAGFAAWKAPLIAVGAILGVGVIAKGLVDIAKHGGDVNHQLELMKIAGMDNAEIQGSVAQAMKTSGNVMTTTLSENLAHIRELRYAFGETSTAMQHLDEISKSNAILNAIKGGGKDQVWELVKSLEQKGLTYKPEEFSSYVNTMTKVVEATGGRVTPEMFMSTFKYGRTSMLGWDEAFVGGALPRLMQSMATGGGGGGSGQGGPGNALMSAFAKVVQGQMPKKAASEWERMGLTPGGVSPIEGSSEALVGDITSKDLFMRNPYEWVQKTLMPALAAHGITDQNAIIDEISKMFPVRTASQIISEMALQGRYHEGMQSPFEKDIRLQQGAMGGEAGFEELMKHDYPTILKAFNQQWKNLLETLGSPLMQPGGPVITAMAGLTSAMGALAQFAGQSTPAIKAIVDVVGQLASITVKIDTFVLGFIAKVTGISAIFEALGALPWSAISTGLAAVNAGLTNLTGAVEKLKSLLGFGAAAKEMPPSFDDRFNALKHKSMFDPGTNQTKATQTAFSLNVDGRALAQTVIEQMEYISEHATGAPAYNGQSHFGRADSGMAAV